jgi:predicted acylesterase/phospholipase RssA
MADPTPHPTERDIGVALSGGGHRATVFGLGALLALADAGLQQRTISISSVSGGSIANGAVMVGPDFGTAPVAAVEAHIARTVHSIADRGILQGGAPATAWYLRAFIACAVVAVVAFAAAAVAGLAKLPIVVAIALALFIGFGSLTLWLFSQRSSATARAIDKELLGDAHTTLAGQQARDLSVHHVICTTEMQGGTTFYFSNRLVYGWEFGGTTRPSELPLSTAVQASACVPGAFRARVVDLEHLNLEPGTLTANDHPAHGEVRVDRIVVVDGGVYDNMADAWEYGFPDRVRRWPDLAAVQSTAARQLIVVNASADWNSLRPMPSGGVRFELDALMRSKDVQYDVSTSHRRQALGDLFMRTGDDKRLDGVFVQIKDSPYRLVDRFTLRPGWTERDRNRWADEARVFLDRYGVSRAAWDGIATASSAVPTTLKPLGPEVCAALLEHGYMLATANIKVIFGHGDTTRTIDRERFTRLARGEARSRT